MKPSGPGGASPVRPRWREPAVVTLVAIAAVGGYVWSIGGCRSEYARHQVWQEVRRIEDALRSGTGFRYWLYVEGEDSATTDAGVHASHEAVLRDFERLARLEGLSLVDLQVNVGAEEAVVSFRVEGRARIAGSRGDQPVPARGEFDFHRTSAGWRLARTRLSDRARARGIDAKGAVP